MSKDKDLSQRQVPGSPLGRAIEDLHPAYFALVMATGIISIAARLLGMELVAASLFWINIAFFVTLWLLYFLRLVFFPRRFLADLFDHGRGPGFFTLVAGTGVLGSQFVTVMPDYRVAFVLWLLAALLWVVLIYTVFTGIIVKENKPSIADGINGGWLTAVVATQSIAVLTGLLATRFGQYQEQGFFLALAMWLFGGMLYIWLISLIFYRYCFFRFSPQDLTPPYWINMGAVAISTLSGTILIANAPNFALFQEILPFLRGFTMFFWATGTWWIPMLLVLGIWRHLFKRAPLRYSPLYWGAVFPLGMYTAATFQLAAVNGLPFVAAIARVFIFAAMAAWLATFTGLALGIVNGYRSGAAHVR
ncbi:MAG: tellurite resistance/C4-dicarboxylate transporter family protein [Chloroflexi bacterium]|nr:tellurite resistance/C4-dicarboxylate transporter family protein [Chloroflexota bacterium]